MRITIAESLGMCFGVRDAVALALSNPDPRQLTILGEGCVVTRSGYTGEDGFEIGLRAEAAEARLVANDEEDGVALGVQERPPEVRHDGRLVRPLLGAAQRHEPDDRHDVRGRVLCGHRVPCNPRGVPRHNINEIS